MNHTNVKNEKHKKTNKKMSETAISSHQMYEIENIGHTKFGMKKVLMMENAGFGIADFIIKRFKNKKLAKLKILAICGSGNNGGDTLVAARHLTCLGINIKVIFLGETSSIKTEEALINFQIISKMKNTIELILNSKLDSIIKKHILNADIIIDGIFGTGIKGNIQDPHLSVIKLINHSKSYIVSVDIPSGLNPNNGEISTECIRANSTITFHRIKTGLLNNRKYTGNLILKKIGIPIEAEEGIV